jgi:hypothetical protein
MLPSSVPSTKDIDVKDASEMKSLLFSPERIKSPLDEGLLTISCICILPSVKRAAA